jgi:two-component system chemotaxis sensor kinase CheA
MVEYTTIAEYAHRFEDALSLMREGSIPVTTAAVTIMLQVIDALREMLSAQAAGQPARIRAADVTLVNRLFPVDLRRVDADAAEDREAVAPEEPGRATRKEHSLRVNMSKLDAMLTLSGEIAVAKSRLADILARSDVGEAGTGAAEEMGRLLATLHERVMEMRLVQIGPLFRQHLRTVRDVAAAQGKLIRLVLEGEDVEVDATIVEQLRDPLTHIVRNAVDHGIEYPAARRDDGKDPCGTILLRARHERGTIIVEIRDDGRGMDRARILERAHERGLVSDVEQLTDSQVFALVTAPGLSTAAEVTELSGRGVGMDVVRRNVEGMRGTLEIESTAGIGTTLRLRLPLTVAIIEGFAVGVADERYVIPVSAVTECLTASDTDRDAARGILSVRGEAMPYVRLARLLGVERERAAPVRESIVIVQSDGKHVGLVVDELLGETQVVIKPLSGLFNHVRGVSGTTIMGDGRVTLILDVAPLLDLSRTLHAAA